MANEVSRIKQQQLDWARAAGVAQQDAYCDVPEGNLPWLSSQIEKEMKEGDGNEFGSPDKPDVRPKIAALHSSSALAVNVFGYWHNSPDRRLVSALGHDGEISRIAFERKFPTGVGPKSPNMDVTLTMADGSLLAIESKFSESYGSKKRGVIQDKYFPAERDLWAEKGLHGAQQAARRLRDGESFSWLDVPQLLKHMLGLANQEMSWHLMLLWYEVPGSHAEEMKREVGLFMELLGTDATRFSAMTYQVAWQQLLSLLGEEYGGYRDYIGKRYFPG